jgi:hypothetical protein
VIREAWVGVHRRRDLRPIYEWARDNVELRAPLTITGKFDVSRSRHFMGPLDALQDDHVREVNVLKPVRGGGTLIADIWVPWTRENDPGPTMFLLQTDDIADDHFQKVLLPTMESVPSIRSMLAALDRHKKTGYKIEFSDGNHLHINGPSVGNLQTNAFRYVVEDECWLYDAGRMADAEARVGDFAKLETSKIFRVSQAGPRERLTLEECQWRAAYQNAAVHEWEVECEHCRKFFAPAFAGVRPDGSFWGITWDKHKLPNGDWNAAKCVPTIRFECEHCGKPLMDSARTKAEWNRMGRYRLTNEENRKRKSFHWETVIDYPWDELVELWLEACNRERRGDLMPKLQFYQKRRAMFMDEQGLLKGGLSLFRASYKVADELEGAEMVEMSIDRQEEDTYWWAVRSWKNGKSRRLGFGKVYGLAALEAIRERFKVDPRLVTMDSAYLPKGDHGVYAACVKYGWTAVRGDKAWSFTHPLPKGRRVQKSYAPLSKGDPGAGTGTEGRRFSPLIIFSKAQMNQKVQELIDSGAWEEPTEFEDAEMEKEYNVQMAGRIRKQSFDKTTNETRVYWWESKNDHARDLANQSVLKAILRDLLPDPCIERLTKSEVAATT